MPTARPCKLIWFPLWRLWGTCTRCCVPRASINSLRWRSQKTPPFSFYLRMCHHTLNVTDEDSLALVYRMIDQFLPLFSSQRFNINGDEPFDLGKGRGKAMADQVGSHQMWTGSENLLDGKAACSTSSAAM